MHAASGDAPGTEDRHGNGCAEAPTYSHVADKWTTLLRLAVLFLSTTLVVAVLFSVLVTRDAAEAPRTAVERQLLAAKALLETEPEDTSAVATYVRALVAASQLSQAEEVLQRGLTIDPNSPALMVEQARLSNAMGDADGAIALLDQASVVVYERRTAREEEYRERGILSEAGAPEREAVIEGALLRAAIFEGSGEHALVTDALSVALDEDPTMADVLVKRAEAYLKLGEPILAQADFEAALRFVPDSEAALKGLADIEESR